MWVMVGACPAGRLEGRQRPVGEDQGQGAAADHRHPQPFGGELANRLSGKGKRMGHGAGVRRKVLPAG